MNEKREKFIQNFNVKFGIDLSDKLWFKCTIEELRESTFTNSTRRDINTAYVIIYDQYIEIYKESIFIKTDMGHRKIFFENITSIDHDKKGRFHLSNSVMINTKSGERAVQLKKVNENDYKTLCNVYENYLIKINNNPLNNIIHEASNADELSKWYGLYEKGIISEEEFESKKKELL